VGTRGSGEAICSLGGVHFSLPRARRLWSADRAVRHWQRDRGLLAMAAVILETT